MPRTALPFLALLLALICLAPAAAAQDRAEQPVPWAKVVDMENEIIDIDFPGGTLGEYCRGLESLGLINIVLTPPAERAPIQSMSARRILVHDAAALPSILTPGVKFEVVRLVGRRGPAGEAFESMRHRSLITMSIDLAAAAAAANQPRPPMLFDINFPGGRLTDYINAIRRANPSANIVLMPGADRFETPAMSFRAVTTDAAMNALNRLMRLLPDGGSDALLIQKIDQPGLESVFVVHVQSSRRTESVRIADVISLAEVLDPSHVRPVRLDDVLSAIDAAMSLYDTPANIKYHPPTRILIVRGDPEQLKQIERVVNRIMIGMVHEPPQD